MQIKNGLRALRPTLVFAAASALAACGGGGGGGYSGGPPPAPVLSLSTTTLQFGAQLVGSSSNAQTLTVSNTGNAALSVSSVSLAGANASEFADTTTCSNVAAGSSCTVDVMFAPGSAGADAATLNISSNAATSPATVKVCGIAEAAATGTNMVNAVIDAGPSVSCSPIGALNIVYVTVKVCAPATQNCQLIDHMQVDTGSSGVRILASALSTSFAAALPFAHPVTDPTHALVECTQFADGYSWGPVKAVDLTIGTATANGIAVQVIGDAAYPSSLAPTACTNGPNTTEEDTVSKFGANGLVGVGYFVSDCGAGCPGDGSAYNDCTVTACVGYAAPVAEQLPNPVSKLASSNNGVEIELGAVSEAQDSASGTIAFGVGATAGSLPAGVVVYQVNPTDGTFTANYKNTALNSSFLDLGSNGLYFPNSAPTIALCASPNQTFYCPVQGSAVLSVTFTDHFNAALQSTVAFNVFDFSQFTNSTSAASGLAGLTGSALPNSFDFGLPFFFGKNVYIAFEGSTLGGEAAPAFAY